jgi:hypothetical protein
MRTFHRQGRRGKGGHNSLRRTLFTSEYCPGGQYSLVNIVRGDIIHGGTIFTPTKALALNSLFKFSLSFGRLSPSSSQKW